jgi:phosphate-selective porin
VAYLEEAYVGWTKFPEASVRAGQIWPPAGAEFLISPLFTDCIERSILSHLLPDLVLGGEVYGEFLDRRISYQVAAGISRANPSEQGSSTGDNSDGRDLWARLVVQPWADRDSALRGLGAGVFGAVGTQDHAPLATEFALETTELGVTFLEPTAGYFEGRRARVGAELSYTMGPGSLQAEYLHRADRVTGPPGSANLTLTTQAWYAQATLILFGAEKVLYERIVPAAPFAPALGDWGAVELVFRAAGASVGRGTLEALGNTLRGEATRVSTFTLGANWILVRNLRLSLNFVWEQYHGPVDFGSGQIRGSLSGLLGRFQIDF